MQQLGGVTLAAPGPDGTIGPVHGINPIALEIETLVAGNEIGAVGREGELEIPDGARFIDANGMTVMPGLIDLHTHVYRGVTYWGISADPVAANTGVTGMNRTWHRTAKPPPSPP